MLFENHINIDGTINVDTASLLRKYEIWSYIYYLYYYNHSVIQEFADMKNAKTGKASAMQFYDVVRRVVQNPLIPETSDNVVPFDVNTLIFFVNKMINTYGNNMMNPVVVYLQKLLENKCAARKLQGLTLVTGRPPNEVEVLHDHEQISNANVSIRVVEKNT